MQRIHRGVDDPDQAWILGELIRYLEHPKSGAHDFHDMGGSWTSVRDSIIAGTCAPRTRERSMSPPAGTSCCGTPRYG